MKSFSHNQVFRHVSSYPSLLGLPRRDYAGESVLHPWTSGHCSCVPLKHLYVILGVPPHDLHPPSFPSMVLQGPHFLLSPVDLKLPQHKIWGLHLLLLGVVLVGRIYCMSW